MAIDRFSKVLELPDENRMELVEMVGEQALRMILWGNGGGTKLKEITFLATNVHLIHFLVSGYNASPTLFCDMIDVQPDGRISLQEMPSTDWVRFTNYEQDAEGALIRSVVFRAIYALVIQELLQEYITWITP